MPHITSWYHLLLHSPPRDDGVGLAAPQVGFNIRLMVFKDLWVCATAPPLTAPTLKPPSRDDGVGLAAPQVGVNIRLMVFNEFGPEAKGGPSETVLVNPEIVMRSRRAEREEEGCLSFPKIYAEVEVRVLCVLCVCWVCVSDVCGASIYVRMWRCMCGSCGLIDSRHVSAPGKGLMQRVPCSKPCTSLTPNTQPAQHPTPNLPGAIEVRYYDVEGAKHSLPSPTPSTPTIHMHT